MKKVQLECKSADILVKDIFKEIVSSFPIADDEKKKAIAIYEAIFQNLTRNGDYKHQISVINDALSEADLVELQRGLGSNVGKDDSTFFDEWSDAKIKALFDIVSCHLAKRNADIMFAIYQSNNEVLQKFADSCLDGVITELDVLSEVSISDFLSDFLPHIGHVRMLAPAFFSLDICDYTDMSDSFDGKVIRDVDFEREEEQELVELLQKYCELTELEAAFIVYTLSYVIE